MITQNQQNIDIQPSIDGMGMNVYHFKCFKALSAFRPLMHMHRSNPQGPHCLPVIQRRYKAITL